MVGKVVRLTRRGADVRFQGRDSVTTSVPIRSLEVVAPFVDAVEAFAEQYGVDPTDHAAFVAASIHHDDAAMLRAAFHFPDLPSFAQLARACCDRGAVACFKAVWPRRTGSIQGTLRIPAAAFDSACFDWVVTSTRRLACRAASSLAFAAAAA